MYVQLTAKIHAFRAHEKWGEKTSVAFIILVSVYINIYIYIYIYIYISFFQLVFINKTKRLTAHHKLHIEQVLAKYFCISCH